MQFDERGHAEILSELEVILELVWGQAFRDQQDGIGPGGAGFPDLVLVDEIGRAHV